MGHAHYGDMSDDVLNSLYENNLPFRLYADFKFGSSMAELAQDLSVPVYWVEEQIESMRLCLEKQVRFELGSN